MNIFGLKITTTKSHNELLDRLRAQVKATGEATQRINVLMEEVKLHLESHSILWTSLAVIWDTRTEKPNGTVRRMLKIVEQALIDDPISNVHPEPVFTKGES